MLKQRSHKQESRKNMKQIKDNNDIKLDNTKFIVD